MLSDLVQHALNHRRRLSLTLTFIVLDDPHQIDVQKVLLLITDSLPVLVYLSVAISRYLLHGFVSALCDPAPNLRELIFILNPAYGRCLSTVPGDIFGGVAPKLRRLVLDGFPLGQVPVPAFIWLNSVHVVCRTQFGDIDFAAHFPRLLRLHLTYYTTRDDAMPESFRFGKLRLHRLIIEDPDYRSLMPAILRSTDVSRFPVFEHIGTKLHPDETLWQQQDLSAVSIRLTPYIRYAPYVGVSVLLVPSHRRWRRAYHINTLGRDEQCPILALPRLLRVDQVLTYLRIDDEYLAVLFGAHWPDLAALRALRVDCHVQRARVLPIWPPPRRTAWGHDDSAPTRRRHVRCPALETLTLSACDTTVTLDSRDIALLGGALAQCERDAQEQAALVLVGIELTEPADDARLKHMFSSVQSQAFSGAGSPGDRDGGLWDEDI